MLKKKRFSGLFGTSMTDIPSPVPDQLQQQQQQTAQHSSYGPTSPSSAFTPQTLASQGRQGSMTTLSTSFSGAASLGANPSSNDDDSGLNSLTRTETHQSLENLKKLVIAAESYRELTTKLAKTTKQLGRCFKEYGDSKGMDSTYVMCLKSSANFYESFSEMEGKLATCLQKDFELLQANWEKHSKRVTKDEKAHDEVLGDLDERIKKISLNYDKKTKKPDPNTALMSHEKYISTLSELQDSIAMAKKDHRNTVARRERYTHSLTAQIACRISEAQFLAIERQLRGSGPSLLKIKEWAPYAGQDMPPPTLTTNGEPTIEIRGGSFEEYIARHVPQQQALPGSYQTPKSEPSKASGQPLVTLSEMPQITLPPFAPMQQQQQQQQKQQQQPQPQPQPQQQQPPVQPFSPMGNPRGQSQETSERQSSTPLYQSPTSTTTPIPMPIPPQPQSQPQPHPNPQRNLPTTMPEPKNYITQKPAIVVPPMQMPTPQPTRTDKPMVMEPPMSRVSGQDQKVLIKESTVAVEAPTKIIHVDTPVPAAPIVTTMPAAEPAPVQIVSPPNTPGAFPVGNTTAGRESETASKPVLDQKTRENAEHLEGGLPEDQGSVSTKVGGSLDGGSTKGDMILSKLEYLREMEHSQAVVEAEDAADAAALDRYHREKYLDRYRYPEDEDALYRGDRQRDMDQDEMGGHQPDDMYDEPYSPLSREHHSFFDDGEDVARLEPRRYYDDEESQHSGSIPIQRDRGEYFASRSRYEERDYDRSYQHYSSSMPTRQQPQHYLSEREHEQAEWAAVGDAASMGGYAREHYPASREYPARPTLEDHERELELMNQKAAAQSMNSAGAPRTAYGRRPGTAPGTVAHLRRRFSDLTVTDMASVSSGMVSPPQGPRPRGVSGPAPSMQQEAVRRDSRYPPRASTPQSRAAAASGYRYERNGDKPAPMGSSGQLVGAGGGAGNRFSVGGSGRLGSEYEDSSNGRMSALPGDQRSRRR
ncbi:hypothetical protein BGZ72_003258 [Mortierella alpina]|nr:hypothetical protein BGZ72_003258 [Mortierella alpina]